MTLDCSLRSLLAVDLGLTTGLASFGDDGRLRWYRSQHFATAAALGRAANRLLRDDGALTRIYIEGGGRLLAVWHHAALKYRIPITCVPAETWRARLLYPRERRSGVQAKHRAQALARAVIEWSRAPRPTSLRHDTCEAILIGLWGVLDAGWLAEVPAELRRHSS